MSDPSPDETSSTPLQDAEEAREQDLGAEDGTRHDGEQDVLDAMPSGTAEGDDQVVGRQPDTGEDQELTEDRNR